MTKIAFSACQLLCASLIVTLAASLPTTAYAQNFISFVASTGSGTACTRAAPCSFIPDAIAATETGGSVKCLDSGPFPTGFTISRTITIDCGDNGGTLVADAGNSITVNGAGIVVILRNLTLLGYGASGLPSGKIAINFLTGAALHVENVRISGYQNSPAFGIKFAPGTAGSQLQVSDSTITENGSGSAGGGIVVSPQAGGSAQVILNRVTVAKNVFGIVADGTGSTAGINMTISDSVSDANSQDGIVATTPGGGAPIGVAVKNTRSTNNGGFGIRSIGPNVTVRADRATVTGNGIGLGFFGAGGALLSSGNNFVEANGTNGAFSGTVTLK